MSEKIEHVGLWAERLPYSYNIPEKVFAEAWQKENELDSCTRPILNSLMNKMKSDFMQITQRDALVAATVIQWLGSNVGNCFVKECHKKIELHFKEPNNA